MDEVFKIDSIYMSLTVGFAVTESGPEAVAGDYFTALELGSSLSTRFGWQAVYLPRGESWYDLTGIDVLVVMLQDYDLRKIHGFKPNLVKVGWARNWFEDWCAKSTFIGYDLLLASSSYAARYMSERIGKLVRVMRIATNSKRFDFNLRSISPTWDVAFTGTYWQSDRDIVDALIELPDHLHIAVFGKHWEQVPKITKWHKGFVPYKQLSSVYSEAAIVIDDSNHVTKEWGAANSRVFDALAAGCLVITNSASVSDEVFDGLLPVYQNPSHLAELVEMYLKDEEARLGLQKRLRDIVIKMHQYKHRAIELGLKLGNLGYITRDPNSTSMFLENRKL